MVKPVFDILGVRREARKATSGNCCDTSGEFLEGLRKLVSNSREALRATRRETEDVKTSAQLF